MAENIDIGTEAKESRTFQFAGIRLPISSLFTLESAAKALTLRPQPGDVILSSYPRCDSRCVDTIVWKLLYTDLKQPPVDKDTGRFLPCLEMAKDVSSVHEYVTRHKLPRLHKTYFPFRLIPFFRRTKYIYVVRSPWELCSAYYSFLVTIGSLTDSFDSFFEDFIRGDVPYGSYFKHVTQWDKRIGESNILILCREHVEHNPRSALFKVAAFLGDSHLQLLLNNEELEREILSDISEWETPTVFLSRTRVLTNCSFDFDDSLPEERAPEEEVNRRPACKQTQLNELLSVIRVHVRNSSIEFLWLNLFQQQLPILYG